MEGEVYSGSILKKTTTKKEIAMRNNQIKDIDTCNGDDLQIGMAYFAKDKDPEAMVCLTYRDEYYENVSEKKKRRHEHILLFTPELAVAFANNLLEFAKSGFVYNATREQEMNERLKKDCPF